MSNIQLVENLYRLRKAHHYTQQEISDLLNISRQAYSNYETSKRTPDLDSLMRLADIYGVSLDQLVNHPCTKDGLILEQKGPFTYAMEIDTADTLYLTREEVELIKGYRAMNPEDKLLLKNCCNKEKEIRQLQSDFLFYYSPSPNLS